MDRGGRWCVGGMVLLLVATVCGGGIAVSAPGARPKDLRPAQRYTYSVNKLPNDSFEKLRHIARYEFVLRFGAENDRTQLDTLDLRDSLQAEAVARFYDAFFRSLDPNPLTPVNEFDSVLDSRINYCLGARRKCFHLNDPGSTVILPLYDMLDDLGKEVICKGIPLMEGGVGYDLTTGFSDSMEVIFPTIPERLFLFHRCHDTHYRWRSIPNELDEMRAWREAKNAAVPPGQVEQYVTGFSRLERTKREATVRHELNTGDPDRLIEPEMIRAEIVPVPGPVYFDEYQALINVFVRERAVEAGRRGGVSRLKVQYAVYRTSNRDSVLALDSGEVVLPADTASEQQDRFFQLHTPCFWRQTADRQGGELVVGLTITRPDGRKWKLSEIVSMDALVGDPPTERAMSVSPPIGTYPFFDQQLPLSFQQVTPGDTLWLWFPVKGMHFDSSAGSYAGIVRVYLTPYVEGRGYTELGPLMLSDSMRPEMFAGRTPPRIRSILVRETMVTATHANSYQIVTARVPNDLAGGRYTVAIEVDDPTGQRRHPHSGRPQPLQWAALTLTVKD